MEHRDDDFTRFQWITERVCISPYARTAASSLLTWEMSCLVSSTALSTFHWRWWHLGHTTACRPDDCWPHLTSGEIRYHSRRYIWQQQEGSTSSASAIHWSGQTWICAFCWATRRRFHIWRCFWWTALQASHGIIAVNKRRHAVCCWTGLWWVRECQR